MNKYLNFNIEEIDIVKEESDSQFATAKIGAFNSGISLNDTNCTEEVLKNTAPTIYFKPILYNISKMTGDFGSHAPVSKTLIGGFVEPDSATFVRVPDGRLRLQVEAKLWKRYSPIAMEILKQDGGVKNISVEIDLLDSEERTDGILEMKDFSYTGVCILGDIIQEASEGSFIEIMSFAEENKEYENAIELEFGSYSDISFDIPDVVKKNVKKGLDLYKQYNLGGTSTAIAYAHHISKNTKTTPEKIRHIAKLSKSNKFVKMTKNPPSSNFIEYSLYGGKEGMDWNTELNNQLDDRDSKQLSYFGKELTFPYKTREDMNPSLKGIDPPITAEQGSEIAKQADAIGADKNGWPEAISSWKNRHKVVDGKWVKKEKTNMTEEEKIKMAAEEAEKEKMAAEEEEKVKMAAEEAEKAKMAAEEEEKAKMAADEEGKKKADEEKMAADEEAKKKAEEDNKNMSNDAYMDVAATLAMLANETDAYSKMVNEEYAKEEKDFAKLFEAACGKMSEMAKENKDLKSFKADVESKQFACEVETTMKYIENNTSMPQEKRESLVAESTKFSLADVDIWKNLARSSALDFAKKNDETKTELVFANPWGTQSKAKSSSIWD